MPHEVVSHERCEHQPDMVAAVITGGLSLIPELFNNDKDHRVTVLNTDTGSVGTGQGSTAAAATAAAVRRAK